LLPFNLAVQKIMRRGYIPFYEVREEGDIVEYFIAIVWALRELVPVIITCLEYIDAKREDKKNSALIDRSEQID
jgi:hypothetical protein